MIDKPSNSESTSFCSLFLLSAHIQRRSRIEQIRMVEEVARFKPLPIWKFGASNGRNDQVEMRPPILPNITTVPIADDRALSDTTFADTWALQRAPKGKAPAAIINVAP